MLTAGHSQWKRAVTAAATTAMNGLGGVAGAFIVRSDEAPRYFTAIWVSIGYVTRSLSIADSNSQIFRSHILILAIVLIFTLHFFNANRVANQGKRIIENTVCASILELHW